MLHGVPDVLFPRSCSLRVNTPVLIFESNGLITTLKIMVGHKCTCADMSTKQVHTLQIQLQQQSFNTYQLTAVKCPHVIISNYNQKKRKKGKKKTRRREKKREEEPSLGANHLGRGGVPSTFQDSHLAGKRGAGQGSPLRVAPGVPLGMGGDPKPVQIILRSTITSV